MRDAELTSLFAFFGEAQFFTFQKELVPHFTKRVPARQRGLFDYPVQTYTFPTMYAIKSKNDLLRPFT